MYMYVYNVSIHYVHVRMSVYTCTCIVGFYLGGIGHVENLLSNIYFQQLNMAAPSHLISWNFKFLPPPAHVHSKLKSGVHVRTCMYIIMRTYIHTPVYTYIRSTFKA